MTQQVNPYSNPIQNVEIQFQTVNVIECYVKQMVLLLNVSLVFRGFIFLIRLNFISLL